MTNLDEIELEENDGQDCRDKEAEIVFPPNNRECLRRGSQDDQRTGVEPAC